MVQKTFGCLSISALLALIPAVAAAQVSERALQLGLGTDVISYTKTSADIDAVRPQDRSLDRSTTRWGVSGRSSLNLELGYGLGDSLVLGGFVGLGGWSQKDDRHEPDGWTKTSTFDLLIAPKLDYMFMPGQSIRPFLGGAVGLQYASEKTTIKDWGSGATVTDSDMSYTGLALLARVGARCFLTPGFSLDPAFSFMWVPTASGSAGRGGVSYDMSVSGYTLGLTVAASGWIGL